MEEKWTCSECGYEENSGKYCFQCGLPREGFTRLEPKITEIRLKEKYREKLPSLKEVKGETIPHGKLVGVKTSSWENGMMMNSHQERSTELRWDSGELLLTEISESGMTGSVESVFRIDASSGIREELQALEEKENLAAWSLLKEDYTRRMMILDWSGGSSVTLYYERSGEDAAVLAAPLSFSFSITAAGEQGGGEVVDTIVGLLKKAKEQGELVSEKKEGPKNTPLMGFGMGTVPEAPAPKKAEPAVPGGWVCPECGYQANTGKFCSECGAVRP